MVWQEVIKANYTKGIGLNFCSQLTYILLPLLFKTLLLLSESHVFTRSGSDDGLS